MIIHYSAGYEGEALNFHGMVEFPRASAGRIKGNENIILERMKKQLIIDSNRRNLNINKLKEYEVYYFDFNTYNDVILFRWAAEDDAGASEEE